MAADSNTVTERLAAQPVSEKLIRNQLISEGYGLREATAQAARMTRGARTRQITEGNPAARQRAIAEAVATAVLTATAARKAAKKAAKRATAETAAARVLQERQQLAAQFTETAIGASLREASSDDLAAIISTALTSAGQTAPAIRPAAGVTVDPRTLSLQELDHAVLAATGRSAGISPFWSESSAPRSPFWRDLQGNGASKGTADA